MLAFAYDIDPYRVWARVTVDGCFDGPWERKFAVGTVFLRGTGSGQIEHVDGVEVVKRELADSLMDLRSPRVEAAKADTYTGDGYITVRHEKTERVEEMLDFIAQTIRITYSSVMPDADTLRGDWTKRLQYKQLYKPAWEVDCQAAK